MFQQIEFSKYRKEAMSTLDFLSLLFFLCVLCDFAFQKKV